MRRALTALLVGTEITMLSLRAYSQSEPVPPLEVTVSDAALPKPGYRDETAASTVIADEALARPGQSAADALRRVPGVEVARTGSSSELATAAIRGATSAQTPVYVAGVRINDDLTGTADLSLVPGWMVHRAEVYRGVSPSSASRWGLAGAIYFDPRLPSRTEVRTGGLVGSFGERSVWGGLSVGANDVAAAFSLRTHATENDYPFVNDNGTRFDESDDRIETRGNADATTTDAWAIGRYRTPALTLTFVGHGLRKEQGVTGLAVQPAEQARSTTQRSLWAISARSDCGNDCSFTSRTSLLLSSLRFQDPENELLLPLEGGGLGGLQVDHEDALRIDVTEGATLDVGIGETLGKLERGAGANVASGGGGLRAQRTGAQLNAMLTVRPSSDWVLSAAGQVLADHTRSTGTDSTEAHPLAKLGVRASATEWLSVFANGARSVRVPTLGERYGVSPLVLGNPELASETGLGFDLGIDVEGRSTDAAGAISALVFARWAEDLIVYRRTSIDSLRPFNESSGRVIGAEASAYADFFDAVRADGSITLSQPERTTSSTIDNALLPYHARLIAFHEIALYRDHPFDGVPLSRLQLSSQVYHRASRIADPAGLIALPARTTFDLELSVSLFAETLVTRARIANLFDDQSTDLVGLPLPGRSGFVSAEAKWAP